MEKGLRFRSKGIECVTTRCALNVVSSLDPIMHCLGDDDVSVTPPEKK